MPALPRHVSFRRFAILLMAPLLAVLFSGLMALALITPAHATVIFNSDTMVTVSEVGDSFGVDYSCDQNTVGGCGDEGVPLDDNQMTAMSFWTVTDIGTDATGGDFVDFEVTIMNTTDPDIGDNVRITQFGVQVLVPEINDATVDNTDSTQPDWIADTDINFPTFGTVALRIDDGQGSPGLLAGTDDTFTLTLFFDFFDLGDDLMLSIFPVKFQGVFDTGGSDGSFEFAGTLKTPPPTTMPEPSTLALFGFGLVGLTGMMRRRRRKAVTA